MPTSIAIVHTSAFIRAMADGVLDLEASRKLLVDVSRTAPLDKQDDAEFFEGVARLEGANVRAFSDFENAVSWLIMREQSRV